MQTGGLNPHAFQVGRAYSVATGHVVASDLQYAQSKGKDKRTRTVARRNWRHFLKST